MAPTPSHDLNKAAIDFILQGEGPSRCGKFVVTVRGGRIVALESVTTKISPETLVQSPSAGQFSVRQPVTKTGNDGDR